MLHFRALGGIGQQKRLFDAVQGALDRRGIIEIADDKLDTWPAVRPNVLV